MMDLFSELFDMFDSMDMFNTQNVVRNDDKKCPVCGHTWSDFIRTGKFGCGECYKTFANGAESVLRQVHSSSRHVGKVPSKSGADIRAKRRLEELKKQLKDAVNREEYEKAAKLHAEIKNIEGGASK